MRHKEFQGDLTWENHSQEPYENNLRFEFLGSIDQVQRIPKSIRLRLPDHGCQLR